MICKESRAVKKKRASPADAIENVNIFMETNNKKGKRGYTK